MRKILKGAVVLLIAIAMVFSTVAVANTQTKETTPELSTTGQGSGIGARGAVVWDNGMDWDIGLMSTQNDEVYPYDCYVADDFHFEEDTEVQDVHWIGGYWNGDPAEFDWCISFYLDDGSGEAPAGMPYQPTFAGPICFAWSEMTIEDLGSGYFDFNVNLPEPLTFAACEKYWISIWGYGLFPPQSGWAAHYDVQLSPCVWGSNFWGYAYWTPGFDIQGYDHDMCFQLTAGDEPVPPTDPVIDGPPEGDAGVEYSFTFHSSDANGGMVRYHIDWGDGNTEVTDWAPACTPVTVTHTYAEKGTYTITAYAEDETGLTSGTSSFTIVIPRAKTLNNQVFQQILGRLFNTFPMLKYLFGF